MIGNGHEHPPAHVPDERDALVAALQAERAGVDHWRRVAAQRSDALERLKRRPVVRVALAIDRRAEPVRTRAVALIGEVHRRRERFMVTAGAVRSRRHIMERRALVDGRVAGSPGSPVLDRSVTIIVADARREPPSTVSGAGTVHLIVATGTQLAAGPGPVVERVGPADIATSVARIVRTADTDLVCLLGPTTTPLDGSWLDRLGAEISGDIGLATPCVLHAERPRSAATAHDLLVREAGLVVRPGSGGDPVLRFRAAGASLSDSTVSGVAPGVATAVDVEAASATCVVFDRAMCAEVGGLDPSGGLDLAVVDLCLRLRAAGARVRCVPDTVVMDDRPVTGRHDLIGPVDDAHPEWRRLVDDHGAAIMPLDGADRQRLRFALTVASPSAKVASRWGDWHLAEALAGSLRRAGHLVRVQTADLADSPAGRVCDVHLVLRGLVPVRRTTGQRHVLWIISHPEAVEIEECDEADLVLVASHRYAAALRERTSTPVEVLLQATDPNRFFPRTPDPAHRHPVTVVAKSRDVLRPMVAHALAAGLEPAIYGSGWRGLIDDDLIVADHVPNTDLAVVYSSAGVVLNDHWETMRAWGFVSNRVFDVLACGTPLVSDHLPEIADLFGDLVATWETADELRAGVDAILRDPEGAGERAVAARRLVLAHHTFDVRARELLAVLHVTAG